MAYFILNILIYLVYLYLCIKVINSTKDGGFLFLPFFYQGALIVPSLIYIEDGGYISEQERYGEYTGSVLLYCIFSFLGLLILQKGLKYVSPFFKKIPSFSVNGKSMEPFFLNLLIYVSLGALFLNLLLSPVPFFNESVDRFDYWKNSAFPFLNNIFGNNSSFLAFGLGVYSLHNSKRKAVFIIFFYFLYLILVGNKFSSLVIAIFLTFLPFFIIRKRFKINLTKLFDFKFIIVGFLLFGMLLYSYSVKNHYSHVTKSPLDAVAYRYLGLQGHVWWGSTYNYVFQDKANTWSPYELLYGMHHLMRELSPHEHIEISIERGVSFTNAYPSILLRIFPVPIALVLHILIVAILCVPIFSLLIHSLQKGRIIFSVVMSQVYIWLTYTLTMGYFYKAIPALVALLIYVIYIFCKDASVKNAKLIS